MRLHFDSEWVGGVGERRSSLVSVQPGDTMAWEARRRKRKERGEHGGGGGGGKGQVHLPACSL